MAGIDAGCGEATGRRWRWRWRWGGCRVGRGGVGVCVCVCAPEACCGATVRAWPCHHVAQGSGRCATCLPQRVQPWHGCHGRPPIRSAPHAPAPAPRPPPTLTQKPRLSSCDSDMRTLYVVRWPCTWPRLCRWDRASATSLAVRTAARWPRAAGQRFEPWKQCCWMAVRMSPCGWVGWGGAAGGGEVRAGAGRLRQRRGNTVGCCRLIAVVDCVRGRPQGTREGAPCLRHPPLHACLPGACTRPQAGRAAPPHQSAVRAGQPARPAPPPPPRPPPRTM